MPIRATDVATFLHFGYLPRPEHGAAPVRPLLAEWNAQPGAGAGAEELSSSAREAKLREGARVLTEAFRPEGRGDHVVPLSSGLDSRAVLALVLANVEARDVTTVTFGIPGTWDFDIAPRIARALGLRHEAIDLSRVAIDVDALMRTARAGSAWTFLVDAFYNRLVAEHMGEGCTFWSGYLGDAVTGAHLPESASSTWEAALDRFVGWSDMTRGWLRHPSDPLTARLPRAPFDELAGMGYDDQLDFAVRQQDYVRRTVMPQEYTYVAPFEDPRVVAFFLDLPLGERRRQVFYRDLMGDLAADFARFPGSATKGLAPDAPAWRRRVSRVRLRWQARLRRRFPLLPWPVHPATNYLDFDAALRRRADFRSLVDECVVSLRERGVVDWIDVDGLWTRHRRGEIEVGQALLLLCALEVNLRVEEEGGKVAPDVAR